MSIGIYKITNPKGKIYIGQSINIEKRFIRYKNYTKHCKQQYKLYNSFIKYGIDNHIFEIIEECSVEQLNEKEIYWGLYFNVLDDIGLNCRNLGDGIGKMSQTQRDNISKSLLGKTRPNQVGMRRSDETKKRMSDASMGKPKSEEHRLKIKELKQNISQETRDKIGNSKRGKPSPKLGKSYGKNNKPSSHKGCKKSLETRIKMSICKLGKKQNGHNIINNITNQTWISKSECALYYNVSVTTINNWVKLKKNNLEFKKDLDVK